MKKQFKKGGIWEYFKSEIILVAGLLIIMLLLGTLEVTEYWGLISILGVLLMLTAYYSLSFFKEDGSWGRLYFYIAMLPFLIGYFAIIYKAFGVVTPASGGEAVQLGWLDALYFSVVTWTTLGYGDFRPDNNVTKIYVMIEVVLGYVYMGLLLGKVLLVSMKNKTDG